ncbi:hypothetical protein SO802_026032 [Lithocarpus litseifolius]|uniref:Aminotransferase-like plant mobile domain-containing protein n=1 Tax=Lithocarpus litseifolius TaxID=425828 RepID=A0AAW2BYX2_9ROSI
MLKSAWATLSPSIKNIINEAGFGTFFETLLNQETHEYKDLQLLLALAECFWDSTCTFHFPSIGEVMLIPYDFFVITGLRLGDERILVIDSLSSAELKKLLGVMPSRMRSNNIPFSWLCESIPLSENVAKGARMFILLLIGTFLCLDLGSTMNLHYLGSLRKIEQIRNYDRGDMAYATLMHFMIQLSRRSFSSLGWAPFVWQMDLDPWVGCEGYTKCERALELNAHQVLFECGHGRYWYHGDRVLPQVKHGYPPTTIPTSLCHTIRLANFLADEEIARARDGYIVAGPPSSKREEGGEEEEEEEISSPYHAGSSSSFMETYPYFLAWQYDVMNPNGTYSSMPLTRPEHVPNVPWPDPVDMDLIEESMRMIRGLQSLARTQSSQYVLNDASWVCHVAF